MNKSTMMMASMLDALGSHGLLNNGGVLDTKHKTKKKAINKKKAKIAKKSKQKNRK